MDDVERVVNQVNVATTMAVVQFLSVSLLHNYTTQLDTCLLTVIVVASSYVCGHENTLILLSRRISMLLLVEMMRPFLQIHAVQSGLSLFTHVQSLMTNVGIVCMVALIPEWWRQTAEGRVVVTAVIYMYTNMLDFLQQYTECRLSIFAVSTLLLWLVSRLQLRKDLSHLSSTALEIAAITVTNLLLALLDPPGGPADTRLLYWALTLTMLYAVSFFFSVACSTEDYLVYAIASEVESFVPPSDWLPWAFASLALVLALRRWIGPNVWITQCSLIVFCDVVVQTALRYIRQLAVHDTIVTLKASALIVQLALHELARRLHGDVIPL